MTTQALIERMAELQVREQEQKLKKAEYEAELARMQVEHLRAYYENQRKTWALPPTTPPESGALS